MSGHAPRLRHLAREALASVVVAAAIYLAARLGLALAAANEIASPLWPPAGVAVAAILLRGLGVSPAVFVGVFLVELHAVDPVAALLLAAGNAAEATVAAFLVRRYAGGASDFARASDAMRYTGSAMAACGLGATIGSATLLSGGYVAVADLPVTWATWWLGDLAGVLVVAPALLLWARPAATSRRLVERTLLAAATAGACAVVFASSSLPTMAFLLVPPIVWVAVRFSARATATMSLALSGVAVAGTVAGRGPFVLQDPTRALLVQQEFMVVTAFVGLVLAALVAELRVTMARLAERVEERTSALERLAGQFDQSQRVAHVGSWEWDVASGRLSWSQGTYRVFGLDPSRFEPSVERYLELVHPADRAMVAAAFEQAAAHAAAFQAEHRFVRPTGEVRILHCVGEALSRPDGLRIGGTIQDVTESRLAEEERAAHSEREREMLRLRETATLRANLLNAISHELKTPLTPLKLQLHLLKDGRLGPLTPRQERAVHVLDRNLARLSKLVDQTVEVARAQGGAGRISRQRVDLAALVREVADTYAEAAALEGVTLVVDASAPVEIEGDPARLMQVLVNLASNALKFTPRGGTIRLLARRSGRLAEAVVADDGAGIAPDDVGRLFQPFVQLDAGLAAGGTGLGLFLSRSIVEAHGGTLEARSAGVGQGAAFVLRIPLLEESVGGLAPAAERGRG